MTNLQLESSIANKDIVVSDVLGNLSKVNLSQVIEDLYTLSCFEDQNGNIANPTWANGTNKIYSACDLVNVGIGTENPDFKLHVLGTTFSSEYQGASSYLLNRMVIGSTDVNASSFGKLLIKNNGGGAGIHIDLIGAANYTKVLYAEVSNPTTEIIKVQNTQLNYTPFLLSSSGTMEIHNGTRKTFLLDATGFLKVRGLRIDQHDWADYVFEQNYKLMPLYEVKKYISENKHLPDVPSEEEVKTNGIDISELNKIYLQKIEELFLYSIEQKQELDELRQELKVLKEMLNK